MNLIEEFLNRVRERIIEDYDSKGLRASGQTEQELKVIGKGNKWALTFPDYFLFEITGRGPGLDPPVEQIREWVVAKGKPAGSEYAIAKKIGKEGTDIFQRTREGIDFQGIFDEEMKIFLKEFGDELAMKIADVMLKSLLKVSTRVSQ